GSDGRTPWRRPCIACLVSAFHLLVVQATLTRLPLVFAFDSRLPVASAGSQSLTSMPIERAVPSTIFIAASMSLALRSGIFVSAISHSCWREIVPTFDLLGSDEPLSTRAAWRIKAAAGGVLVTKVNERSS